MALDSEWEVYTSKTYKGAPTGHALRAIKAKTTPLEPDAILDLLYQNLCYFGNSYYNTLTRPVEMRVEEYFQLRDSRA